MGSESNKPPISKKRYTKQEAAVIVTSSCFGTLRCAGSRPTETAYDHFYLCPAAIKCFEKTLGEFCEMLDASGEAKKGMRLKSNFVKKLRENLVKERRKHRCQVKS